MESSSQDDSPVDALHQETLIRFATLMGTFRIKNQEQSSLTDGCKQALSSFLSKDYNASFPSLSLDAGDQHHHHTHHLHDKNEIKAMAWFNLSKPLTCSNSESSSTLSDSTNSTCEMDSAGPLNKDDEDGAKVRRTSRKQNPGSLYIHQVPSTILENLAASFAFLLDARLRAYTVFLSSHEASLAESLPDEERQEAILAIEHKLVSLVECGTAVSSLLQSNSIVTAFHLKSVAEWTLANDDVDGSSLVKAPLVFEAVMDVSIPNHASTTISVQTSGTMEGTFEQGDSVLKSVIVDIDAHKLLDDLVDRAGHVMAMAVDQVNSSLSAAMERGEEAREEEVTNAIAASTETSDNSAELHMEAPSTPCDMPPPEPRSPMRRKRMSDDLYEERLPIVSPDIGSLSLGAQSPPPPLLLEEKQQSPPLSPESCANIVDNTLVDTFCFNPPPTKRIELLQT